MSFILNALRKSEQERRQLESETLTDRILPAQPIQKRNKTSVFLALLILGNVFIIAGIVWFFQKNSTSKPDITISAPTLTTQEKKSKPKTIAKLSETEKPTHKVEPNSTSIANLIDEQKPAPTAAPIPAKPIIEKNTVTATPKPAPVTPKPAPTIQAQAPIPTQSVTVAKTVEPGPEEIVAIKSDIPFLSELPIEFRKSVPKLNINVFVYSQHPEDRFVMIDMVKYKPGQQIKDTLLLKEILPVSMVIVYQNQEFQIERP